MKVELKNRSRETVVTYFNRTRDPQVRKFLPQKAVTEAEALADFYRTQLPGAASYGRAIYADGVHVGDIWCYCIQRDEPNAMISYCVFDRAHWGRGVATAALERFLAEIAERYGIKTVGAFTYAANRGSVRVLQKCGFEEKERFMEDGMESQYFQRDVAALKEYAASACGAGRMEERK